MKLLIFLGVSLLCSATTALKCFQCEYYERDNKTQSAPCNADPLDKNLLQECVQEGADGPDWQCVKKSGKIIVTIDDEDEEFKYVSRSCSYGKTFENDCKESDALDTQFGTAQNGLKCFCNTEGCNSATVLSHGIFTTILLSVANIMFSVFK